MHKNKIIILGSANSYNYGTFMILINFIDYFSKITKRNYEYSVFLASSNDCQRLRAATNNRHSIRYLEHKYFVKSDSLIKKFINMINDF
jgi:hypothetical protein